MKPRGKANRRKDFEPGRLCEGGKSIYWPEHPLSNKEKYGVISLGKLDAWQRMGHLLGDELDKLKQSRSNGSRLVYRRFGSPGALNSVFEGVYWPEHVLASSHNYVSLKKLDLWQRMGYPLDERLDEINRLRRMYKYMDAYLGGPSIFYLRQYGYIAYKWPMHPLAKDGEVKEHQLVYFQKSGYSLGVLDLLLNGAHVHHLNGTRDDNRPENLELRIDGNHPKGIGESDMVKVLTTLGYKIQKPIQEWRGGL